MVQRYNKSLTYASARAIFFVLPPFFLLPGASSAEKSQYHYIFTTPNTQRARTAEEMLALWGKEGLAINDPKEAIDYSLKNADETDAIFIGGSNYLVGEALSIMDKY